jgi:hypothetical protein
MLGAMQGKPGMIFTIEFFRIRPSDDAHATLLPQKPDGLRILDEGGCELFFWNQWKDDALRP